MDNDRIGFTVAGAMMGAGIGSIAVLLVGLATIAAEVVGFGWTFGAIAVAAAVGAFVGWRSGDV